MAPELSLLDSRLKLTPQHSLFHMALAISPPPEHPVGSGNVSPPQYPVGSGNVTPASSQPPLSGFRSETPEIHTPQADRSSKRGTIYASLSGDDKATVESILFVMDKFGVGDPFMHELSMIMEGCSKSYLFKECRSHLNSNCNIKTTPGKAPGAQLSFVEQLKDQICEQVIHTGIIFLPLKLRFQLEIHHHLLLLLLLLLLFIIIITIIIIIIIIIVFVTEKERKAPGW